MAEVSSSDVWFVAVALIFVPLTGKNDFVASVGSGCKSLDIVTFRKKRVLSRQNNFAHVSLQWVLWLSKQYVNYSL